MSAYYNEIDPYAAQWLRNLIAAGEIAPGVVDERSIEDVLPDDLKGFTQCHFFAGIGGWSIALRQAGWADDRPVWTGSCPCQPFSAAGAGKAADDERHLWPAWFSLIAQRRPAVVFGEQVEAAIGWGWLDAVFADLEKEGYACGASVLPACGVGAPHIRNRLWLVGHANGGGEHGQSRCEGGAPSSGEREVGQQDRQRLRGELGGTSADSAVAEPNREIIGRKHRVQESAECSPPRTQHIVQPNEGGGRPYVADGGNSCTVANTDGRDAGSERQQRSGQHRQQPQDGGACELAYASDSDRRRGECGAEAGIGQDGIRGGRLASGSETGDLADAAGGGFGEQRDAPQPRSGGYADGGFWSGAEWIACTDGKSRPIGPGSFPLAHGVQRRPSKLRAYGNAIVPQVAAEFILAYGEAMTSVQPL